MKNIHLLLLAFLLSLTSCAASIAIIVRYPSVGEIWRAEEFKDLDNPNDAKIIRVNNHTHMVTFILHGQSDIQNINSFIHDYTRLTLPNSVTILQRHRSKIKSNDLASK